MNCCRDQSGGNVETASFIKSARLTSRVPIQLVVSGARHRAKAANTGLAAATGTLVHFLDDDDTVAPSFYRNTSEFLTETPASGRLSRSPRE